MIETVTSGRPMSRTRAVSVSTPRARSSADGSRRAEFDALRATSVSLVVVVHAALGYLRSDIPGLLWAVRDRSTHPVFDLFVWWSMGVSVALFFTISGFFADAIEEAKGPTAFLLGRARRILVPFLIASATILPLCFLAFSYGWIAEGRADFNEFRRMRFLDRDVMAELYGPAHLWFLEYLLLMLVGFWAIKTPLRLVPRSSSPPDGPGRWLLAPWTPLLLAIPTTVLMKFGRDLAGVDVSLNRHNSFAPDPFRFLHYASFFVFGVGLHRARARLDVLARRGPLYLAATVPLVIVRASLLPRDWDRPFEGVSAWGFAAIGGLLAWLNVFGFLGVYRLLFSRPSRLARHLADASFWVYLIHLPVVVLAQGVLYPLPWPTWSKFALCWLATMLVGLGSYHVFVRRRPPTPPRSALAGPHRAGRTWRSRRRNIPSL